MKIEIFSCTPEASTKITNFSISSPCRHFPFFTVFCLKCICAYVHPTPNSSWHEHRRTVQQSGMTSDRSGQFPPPPVSCKHLLYYINNTMTEIKSYRFDFVPVSSKRGLKASFHSGKLSVDWNGQENFSLSCELWVETNDFNTKKNFLVRSNPRIIFLSGN